MEQQQYTANKAVMRDMLAQHTQDTFADVWEDMSRDLGLPPKYDIDFPAKVANLQLDTLNDDLEGYALDSELDDPTEVVAEFATDYLTYDDVRTELEREFSEDDAWDYGYEEMVLQLKNTAPFADASDGFWEQAIRSNIRDYRDLFGREPDEFVETFFPDWEETAYEI